ncbi:MobA/MobL family protein [Selenomonas sp. FC4001]|uniref:MobA/MobL family protein n=1 Tax=Selenomonas sp. FC4001 TaxID=1408313 RepID=UPI000689BF9F|nr:MobA/MobL family protein [Selenomonas sp. FC4001]
MASYHFTIKVDQKPDKTTISAATHADYINRDGSFQNIDFKREIESQILSGCILRPAHLSAKAYKPSPLSLPRNKDAKFLYKSIYGSILETANGIEYTDGASTETRQIALALAKHRYGDTLALTGPLSEISSILRAGQAMDYPVEFASNAINSNYQRLLEENHYGTDYKRGRTEKSHHGEPTSGTAQAVHLPHLESNPRKRPSAKRTPLRTLLQRNLDENHRNSGMLLQINHAIGMEQSGTLCPDTMRRDFRWGTRRKVDDIAARILAQADGITPASHHADYINRRNSFAPKGGCIYKHHHLPSWAKDNPKTFFQAADKYERANGTRYREIEFALPNELNMAEQKEIIDTFIEHHLENHYYAYAIHDKIGVMSNGEHNTHVHIMFSEREIDDVERLSERPAELFFHRANSKHPERGGCPKAVKWNDKNRAKYLCEMRRDFAKIQNVVLQKYGIDASVDHRSLKAQYKDALRKGDLDAALLLNRLPENHLGPALAADKNNPKVIDLMEYRAYKFKRSSLAHMIDQLKLEHAAEFAQESKDNLHTTLIDQELHGLTAAGNSTPELFALNDTVSKDYQSLVAMEKILISKESAMELAMEHILPAPELTIIRAQKKLTQKQNELKALRTSLLEMGDSAVSDEIIQAITDDILHQKELTERIASKIQEVEEKLSSPNIQKQLNDIAKDIIRADKFQQREYWNLIQKLNQDTQLLQDEMDKAIIRHVNDFLAGESDITFSTRDIKHYLDSEVHSLKKAIQLKSADLEQLKKRLITPERANLIARSRYLKGADKALRQDFRNLQKEAECIAIAQKEYEATKAEFASLPKPKWYQSSKTYNDEANRIFALGKALQERQQNLSCQQDRLNKKQSQLEQQCAAPEAKSYISFIASRILQKDLGNVTKAQKLETSLQDIRIRLDDVLTMQAAVKAELMIEQPLKLPKENNGRASARRRMEDVAHSLIKSTRNVISGLAVSLHHQKNLDYGAMNQTEKEAQSEITI